jgi:NAD(P)-dependent dehydrogenase (short-subunit alcohol dehydrogenase family)
MSRTILITGCSSGIGRAAADALRARDWRVIAACRQPADVTRLRDDGFDSVCLDYSDERSVAEGWQAALSLADGRMDAVFNNGGHGMPGAAEDLPRAALECVFHSNVFGVHQLTGLAARHMMAHGGGRIVQHSSTVGFTPLRWRAAYVASKHAVEGLTNTMRVELRGTGVHLSILNTGPVTSGFRANSTLQFERWIDADASRHASFYRTTFMARQTSDKPDLFERPASAVVKRLIHAIESDRPRARYYITLPTWVAAVTTRVLPSRAQDWLVSKI